VGEKEKRIHYSRSQPNPERILGRAPEEKLGGARKKFARCTIERSDTCWVVFGSKIVNHGAILLSLPGAYSKIGTQLLANLFLSLVHVHHASSI
jgi:hypothetical protein